MILLKYISVHEDRKIQNIYLLCKGSNLCDLLGVYFYRFNRFFNCSFFNNYNLVFLETLSLQTFTEPVSVIGR